MKFHKESFQIVRFWAKNRIFEKSPKSDFLAQNFFNKGKKYFWTKITKNLPKPSKCMCLGNVFSLFKLISYFWKFWPKKPKKKKKNQQQQQQQTNKQTNKKPLLAKISFHFFFFFFFFFFFLDQKLVQP